MGAESSNGFDPDPRVLLAAERTLLAWLRTGIALMGFGFMFARLGMFLHEMAELSGKPEPLSTGGEIAGVGMVVIGVLVNLWASVRHRQMMQRLRRGETDIGVQGPIVVGIVTVIGGLVLAAVLVALF